MQLISSVLGLGWNLVRCQNQRSHRRNSDWNCFGEGAGKGRGCFPSTSLQLATRRGQTGAIIALTPCRCCPAASSHSPVVPALRDHVPSHSQHQELGVTPVLQVLINEPSLGSVGLPSPWNRILLARLPLHHTAAFFFALHLQISARTTISKQICSELMAGLEIWKNPWQIFASLYRKPRGYFS